MSLAELRGVTRRFRGCTALDAVDLVLAPGSTGLLGPNGAGKSTLLRLLSTVARPTEGSVTLLGRNAADPDELPAIRRQLGYLPQDLGFPPGLTAFGFLDYVAVLKEWTDRRARHAEVRRVLQLVDLSSRSTTRISRLSGGMRRRLGLAQALLGRPRLLLLDEPTSGSDPEQRDAFRQLVLEHAPHGAVVFATHQTEDVAAVCANVLVLSGGAIRFHGPVAQFVDTARGRVWIADSPDATALAHRRTESGRYRQVGDPPPDTEPTEPQIEDAYLLLQRGVPGTRRS